MCSIEKATLSGWSTVNPYRWSLYLGGPQWTYTVGPSIWVVHSEPIQMVPLSGWYTVNPYRWSLYLGGTQWTHTDGPSIGGPQAQCAHRESFCMGGKWYAPLEGFSMGDQWCASYRRLLYGLATMCPIWHGLWYSHKEGYSIGKPSLSNVVIQIWQDWNDKVVPKAGWILRSAVTFSLNETIHFIDGISYFCICR